MCRDSTHCKTTLFNEISDEFSLSSDVMCSKTAQTLLSYKVVLLLMSGSLTISYQRLGASTTAGLTSWRTNCSAVRRDWSPPHPSVCSPLLLSSLCGQPC